MYMSGGQVASCICTFLGWRKHGYGRHDRVHGEVPGAQRRLDALDLAWQHGAEVSEWNLSRQDTWSTRDGFDENLTPFNVDGDFGPVPETDGSD